MRNSIWCYLQVMRNINIQQSIIILNTFFISEMPLWAFTRVRNVVLYRLTVIVVKSRVTFVRQVTSCTASQYMTNIAYEAMNELE
jgi:hypothetical protein